MKNKIFKEDDFQIKVLLSAFIVSTTLMLLVAFLGFEAPKAEGIFNVVMENAFGRLRFHEMFIGVIVLAIILYKSAKFILKK